MDTKLSQVQSAMANQDWRTAFRIAAKFPRLGAQRNAILDAHMAFTNPSFLVQIKRDVDACIADGISALTARFGQ